jgi:hypothetical protein
MNNIHSDVTPVTLAVIDLDVFRVVSNMFESGNDRHTASLSFSAITDDAAVFVSDGVTSASACATSLFSSVAMLNRLFIWFDKKLLCYDF